VREFFKKLFSLLSPKDKKTMALLVLFSIVLSVIETVGVGVIMPFIDVASDFQNVFKYSFLKDVYQFFGFDSPYSFVLAFGGALLAFYVLRGVLNLTYFYFLYKFTNGRYYSIAYRLFENYLSLEYKNFISKNTSILTKNIITEAYNLVEILQHLIFMLGEIFVFLFIYSFLIYVNWKMTLLLTLFLGLNLVLLKLFVSVKIQKAGIQREKFQSDFFNVVKESFWNLKLIKLKSKEQRVLDEFKEKSLGFVEANIKANTLIQFPRIFLELVGFSLVVLIVMYLIVKYQQNIKAALPLLLVFVLGLYRLLPSVNRIFTSVNEILFKLQALNVIHNELIYEKEELGDRKLDFKNEIEFKKVGFGFGEKEILKNIDLKIKKGDKLGVIGESGSGKSTFVDLLIGLYKPLKGEILIDGEKLSEKNLISWRTKIGYIPQAVYLLNDTIAKNVAFLDEVDEEKVKEALKKANLLEYVESLKDGIHTKIGENGIALSGGQRQRLAIARALYNDPEILVLDEATSALDTETEKKIMDEIYKIGKDKTMVIVAHRLSTLDKCDRIINIENGEIK